MKNLKNMLSKLILVILIASFFVAAMPVQVANAFSFDGVESDEGSSKYAREFSDEYLQYLIDLENGDIEKYGGLVPDPFKHEAYQPDGQATRAVYPQEFDPRPLNLTTPVKNQGSLDTCWAFATVAVAEAFTLKQTGRQLIYSEEHLRFYLSNQNSDWGFGRTADSGGNFYMSGSYFLSNIGAVLASEVPYTSTQGATAPSNLHSVDTRKIFGGTKLILGGDYDSIKDSVLTSGAVYLSMHMVSSVNTSNYYSTENFAYYYNGTQNSNHAVAIVGWDDEFSKDNFNTKPSIDGAWLVKNSYGTSFGDGGYFWISYDDNAVKKSVTYTFISVDSYDNDVKVLSYDTVFSLSGWGYSDTNTVYGANVFEISENQADNYNLTDVKLYLMKDYDYEVMIFNVTEGMPNQSKLESAHVYASGSSGGYELWITVPLDQAVTLSQGKYAVVIKYINKADTHAYICYEHGKGTTYTPTIEMGQSMFTKTGSTWYDLLDTFIDHEEEGQGNFQIKAVLSKKQSSVVSSELVSSHVAYKSQNLNVEYTANGNYLEQLMYNNTVLFEGIDYQTTSTSVLFLTEFLNSLPKASDNAIKFVFSGGDDLTLTIDTRPHVTQATITGEAKYGNTLTANATISVVVAPESIKYQWQSASEENGAYSDIAGATSKNYLPTVAEIGKYIRVKISLIGTEYQADQVLSASTQPILDTRPSILSVSLSGGAEVGYLLTAKVTLSQTLSGAELTYKWYSSTDFSNYAEIAGETRNTYTITEGDVGKVIIVTVISKNTNVKQGSFTSPPSPIVGDGRPYLMSVSIAESVMVGKTLQATVNFSATVTTPDISYKWQISTDGLVYSDITDSASLSYKIKETDINKYLRLYVTSNGTNIQKGYITSAVLLVKKGTPQQPPLAKVTYAPGLTLDKVILPDGWTWIDETVALTAGTKTFKAHYIGDDCYLEGTIDIVFVVEKAERAVVPPTLEDITYADGVTLASITLPAPWRWEDSTVKISAGTNNYRAVYPGDSNYNDKVVLATINILKAEPIFPQAIYTVDYRPDLDASMVELPTGWAWDDEESNLVAGEYQMGVTYVETTNYLSAQTTITLIVRKAKPLVTLPQNVKITYFEGIKLSNISLTGEWVWEEEVSLNAGDYDFYIVYYPADTDNYEVLREEIKITVDKANPIVDTPVVEDRSYSQGLRISDMKLPSGWTWEVPGALLYVGIHTYKATFTPSDTRNYNQIVRDIRFEISKGTPSYTLPQIPGLEYVQDMTLSNVTLAAGWKWEDPTTPINSTGTFSFSAIFTPNDTANYKTVTASVSFTVRKGTPVAPVIDEKITIKDEISLKEIQLPEGWRWKEPEAKVKTGTNTFTAIFDGTNNFNMRTVSVTFVVEQEQPLYVLIIIIVVAVAVVAVVVLIIARSYRRKKALAAAQYEAQYGYGQPQDKQQQRLYKKQQKQYMRQQKQAAKENKKMAEYYSSLYPYGTNPTQFYNNTTQNTQYPYANMQYGTTMQGNTVLNDTNNKKAKKQKKQ